MKPEKYVDSTGDNRTANNTVRHQYRVLSDEEKHLMQKIKDHGLELMAQVKFIEPCREASIAETKIEEAVMWAVKGLTK